ncbi:hypothetical protein [Nocardia xishanensis]|uniref:hypothetical protein n=1 Tax=Nocardia xishanensis TaxID=238964 RepID=UPI0033C58E76
MLIRAGDVVIDALGVSGATTLVDHKIASTAAMSARVLIMSPSPPVPDEVGPRRLRRVERP